MPTTEQEVTSLTPKKSARTAPVAPNRIVFYRGQDAYEIAVRYTENGGTMLAPLVAQLTESMFASAVHEHRRARGEVPSGRGLDLAFEESDAASRFFQAWAQISKVLSG